MDSLSFNPPNGPLELGDEGAEFNMDAEWKWFEDFSPEFQSMRFDAPLTTPDALFAPAQNTLTSNAHAMPPTTEPFGEPELIASAEEPRFAPQLGVFDCPLDPGGLSHMSEVIDNQANFSTASKSESPRAGMNEPYSRSRSDMRSHPPGLPRHRSRYSRRRLGELTPPVLISPGPSAHDVPDPMQRWQDSPPEDEPASISAIMDAVRSSEGSSAADHGRSGAGGTEPSGRPGEAFRAYRNAASSTSGESGASKSSRNSLQSENSGSGSSRNSSALRPRRSRGRITKSQQKNNGKEERRIFCCTFCCDRFKSKYDWTRHEKSLHLNLEAWICAPFGGAVFSTTTQRPHCAYCHALEPDAEHLKTHNHQSCHGDSREPRVFRRKDHLVQHLRLVHDLQVMPLIDDWKLETPAFKCRCGICDQTMNSWDERTEHIAAHYKQGSTMRDWHGEHDFPPSIAAQVTHALSPYLIDSESASMVPFSATDSNTRDHFFQISSNAGMRQEPAETQPLQPLPETFTSQSEISSFTQILTMHLSRYAQDQMKQGIVPTDEMFQQVARRLLYDCEDNWNQTVADNGQWLSAFRQLHCQPDAGDRDQV
ncbi:unnamed protein product [Penicillium salamii]|uniref:C2H2-type domain-containing protein n=1 Tax=Penicillium salamii TaxID=1612424 RepID=A0A9W4IK34_9EURO|nr:unnamed protein product [Penicillium salamii]CAG8259525.1 unnamed protein product [Penicillium salamii]CAG8283668.1 unnamed protein product [Penicillium salamii]CAG8290537.1 unnamed protein product [Penicillium salamii]CAG8297438.1 unnamed protein product [Penicillium salamii]